MSWAELARLNVRCRPIIDWPQPLSGRRKHSPFKARWATTVAGLARELKHLGAKDIAMHLAVPESKIVGNGTRPYADARPDHPGVLLAFDSKHGPLHYAVDTFNDWQDNVRAIVLTLENLRAIERYGTVSKAQQYRGFRALPDATQPAFALDDAVRWLIAQHDKAVTAEALRTDPDALRTVYRKLAERMHPDKPGGSNETFAMLGDARRVIQQEQQRKGVA